MRGGELVVVGFGGVREPLRRQLPQQCQLAFLQNRGSHLFLVPVGAERSLQQRLPLFRNGR